MFENFINGIISVRDTIILMLTQPLLFLLLFFFARIIFINKHKNKTIFLKKLFLVDIKYIVPKPLFVSNLLTIIFLLFLITMSLIHIFVMNKISSIGLKSSIILFYINILIYSLMIYKSEKTEKR